jgi:hypothetical protein
VANDPGIENLKATTEPADLLRELKAGLPAWAHALIGMPAFASLFLPCSSVVREAQGPEACPGDDAVLALAVVSSNHL